MKKEEWVLVHDGFYEVSSLGNVRRAKPGISTFVGRPIIPCVGAGGYLQVSLGGEKQKKYYVHQLIAFAFIGHRPDGHVINHKDCDRQNNSVCNLEYVTYAENSRHAIATKGRARGPSKPKQPPKGMQTGEKHWTKRMPDRIARAGKMPHSKLTEDKVFEARRRVSNGETQKSVAIEMGVSVAQMSRVIRGLRWTNV